MTSTGAAPGEPELFDLQTVDSGDWWCLITLTGELDLAGAPRFRQAVDDAVGRNRRHLAIDATGLTFIDSSGLVALLAARDEVTSGGGSLRLTGASTAVTRVLRMAGLIDELLDHRR